MYRARISPQLRLIASRSCGRLQGVSFGGAKQLHSRRPGTSINFVIFARSSLHPVQCLGGVRFSHDEPAVTVAEVKEARELIQKVETLWEQDKTDEAIAGMHQLITADPNNYDLLEKLGDMYLAVGEYDASARQYANAIEVLEKDPTRGLQRWTERMSYLLVKLGESKERSPGLETRFDDAEAEYRRAIELNPGCVEAHHRLGYLNLGEGYLQTADESFDNGIAHAGAHGLVVAELWFGKAECRMKQKEWRKAVEFLKKACEADSTYAPAFFKLGQCLQKDKDWLGAIKSYDQYFDLFHKYYGAYGVDAADQRLDSSDIISDVMLRRGICYINYGDPTMALSDLEAVISIDNPKFVAYAHHFRGKAHFHNSEFWKAIDDQTEAINRDPQLFDAYLERSTCYDLVGLPKEAEEDKKRYEHLRRTRSWEMRQAMLEGHFGAGARQDD